ncbi:hypothetical protein [Planosporangium mesophilum]|uniref:Uncharacterized protein n=1 Tax=Planosporangium mesophilum TaxID=689768 RepID=A0A8J3T8P3_9ACTN|nr:hypothetical protein [Planosporangium mesophilum]NJC83152.1 hypothetical protein [Planosporangium mesophilum]GII22570.1 hypothetical protein Pme01_21670 [Planosporangium mesophilum]
MSATDAGHATQTAATVESAPAAPADRYAQTLTRVDQGLLDLRAMLAYAQGATPSRRVAALVALYSTCRSVCNVLNDALGNWPEPTKQHTR